MKLTMLGTGNAMATACYNTCFALEEQGRIFLVDAGGGNLIFTQLQKASLDWRNIQDIFVTHKHIDHILGVLWMIRLYCQKYGSGAFQKEVRIYGHEEVISALHQMVSLFLVPKQSRFLGDKLLLIPVQDGQVRQILGHPVTFFDIHSTKEKQFGFTLSLPGGKLACCGDEPFCEANFSQVQGSRWLLHEAYCLYSQKERFKPYEKHHSTVKDACETAQRLRVDNLILYHTEDHTLPQRKVLYQQEGSKFYSGRLFVPEDLECLDLTGSPLF